MAVFWTETGEIESLGNSSIESECTVYTVIKFRDTQGTLKSVYSVSVYQNVNKGFVQHHHITIYGFKISERNEIYACINGNELLEDIDEVQKGKKNLKLFSLFLIVMTIIAGMTITGVIAWVATIPLAVIFSRAATNFPTAEKMRAQLRTSAV